MQSPNCRKCLLLRPYVIRQVSESHVAQIETLGDDLDQFRFWWAGTINPQAAGVTGESPTTSCSGPYCHDVSFQKFDCAGLRAIRIAEVL
jgi:hypothetical protein